MCDACNEQFFTDTFGGEAYEETCLLCDEDSPEEGCAFCRFRMEEETQADARYDEAAIDERQAWMDNQIAQQDRL